ncbi:hypothetical protein LNQ49_23120 [Flavobacterium sp. F-65]|jgi:hypothetical protein|uniref:Uncharacterized protein n=1 Tax=Flavobacterium pisciphilum TaxID=2893755 RepID=A0ABS8N267_9FLAO|nr:hypothetical protein [Flavobacterium sp. F-65]MCC9074486.1 hypothetical protein [Flavobacterium sp. F-65]
MNIKYRSVYLSDLKKIVDLYAQQDGFKINVLTQDFGLPQHIMTGDNDEILACSFVLFNESDEITYRVLSDKGIVSGDMAENLLNFTKKEEKSYPIKENLKNSICRLTNLINHSV